MGTWRCLGVVAGFCASPSLTLAGLSQAQVASPGGFVQAGAFTNANGSIVPGGDLSTVGPPAAFQEEAFAGLANGAAQAAAAGATYTLIADADAGMGFVRGMAFRDSPNTGTFAMAALNGGWKETFTVSHPALAGQPGFLVFQISVRGTLDAAGFSGGAGVTTTGYKDDFELIANSYFNRGNSDPISTDRQRAFWGTQSFGSPEPTRVVDGVVTMAAPITFGQPFTLGVYAFIQASQSSLIGIAANSTGAADFSSHGVTWRGIASVLDSSGAPQTGWSVVSGTGLNWPGPVGQPCRPDLTTTAVAGQPGYGVPNGILSNDDFFYYLAQFAAGNLAVADLTTTAVSGAPGYGVPNGVLTNDDFFYYLTLFAEGC